MPRRFVYFQRRSQQATIDLGYYETVPGVARIIVSPLTGVLESAELSSLVGPAQYRLDPLASDPRIWVARIYDAGGNRVIYTRNDVSQSAFSVASGRAFFPRTSNLSIINDGLAQAITYSGVGLSTTTLSVGPSQVPIFPGNGAINPGIIGPIGEYLYSRLGGFALRRTGASSVQLWRSSGSPSSLTLNSAGATLPAYELTNMVYSYAHPNLYAIAAEDVNFFAPSIQAVRVFVNTVDIEAGTITATGQISARCRGISPDDLAPTPFAMAFYPLT